MQNLIDSIHALLAVRGVSPSAVAASLKTTPGTMSRILSGKVLPSHETLQAIIQNLATTEDERREIARAWVLDELDRIGVAGILQVAKLDAAEHPEITRLKTALRSQSQSIEHVADLASDIIATCTRIESRTAAAARDSPSAPIKYHPALHQADQVAEDAPAKLAPKPAKTAGSKPAGSKPATPTVFPIKSVKP